MDQQYRIVRALGGLRRIGDDLRSRPRSPTTLDTADAYFRDILALSARLTDAHSRHLAKHSVIPGLTVRPELWDESVGKPSGAALGLVPRRKTSFGTLLRHGFGGTRTVYQTRFSGRALNGSHCLH